MHGQQQQQQHPTRTASPISVYRILSGLVAKGAANSRPKSSPGSASDWWEEFSGVVGRHWASAWFRDPEKRHRLLERAYQQQLQPQTARMSAAPASTETRRPAATASADDEEKATKARRSGEAAKKGGPVQNVYLAQGHNGQALVEAAMERLGWTKTTDKTAENWRLRWTETKGMVNYSSFREGEQLVNHIPNCELICNKLGLLLSLREFERVSVSMKARPHQMQLADFFPETYVLDYPREREAFFEAFRPGEIWINKPTGLNQGKGIFLVRDLTAFKEELQQKEEKKAGNPVKAGKSMGRIVQRYIMNPLLIHGRKFDIRTYLLIGSTAPYLILFHHGYLRLSIHKYDTDDANLCTHLTNQYIQKKDERYEQVKDDTIWSMGQFNDYMNSLRDPGAPEGAQPGPPEENWVFNGMERQMKAILLHMFSAVKHKLTARLGYFELYGIDFMIDADYKMYLIEVNTNPAMHVNCKLLNDLLPPLIERTIHIALECFNKSKKRQSLLPLKSLGSFQVLHCGVGGGGGGGGGGSGSSQSRPQRTGSPQASRGTATHSRQQPQPPSGASPTRASAAPDTQQQPQPQPLRRQATSPNVLPQQSGAARRPYENSLRRFRPAQRSLQQQPQPQTEAQVEETTTAAGDLQAGRQAVIGRQERPELISSSPGILLTYNRVRTPVRREAAPISTVRVIGGGAKEAVEEKLKLSASSGSARRRPIVDRSS